MRKNLSLLSLLCALLLSTAAAQPPDNQCPAEKAAPKLAEPIREGATQVSGTGTPFTAPCTVKVEIHDVSDEGDRLLAVASGASGSVNNDGTFTVTLAEPLRAGQSIAAVETFTDSTGSKTTPIQGSGAPTLISVIAPAEWGRIKGYFASGILISQNQGNFSQSSLYIGFTLDKTWRLPGYYHQVEKATPTPTSSPTPVPTPTPMRLGRWPGINTYFDVRLTQIPVSACSTTSTTGAANQPSPCAAPTPTPATTPTNLETFLSAQKSARLAVGIYLPWTVTAWTYNGTPNALFIAPLAKVGFDTPAGSLNQALPSAATGTNPGTVTAVNPTNFYNFYVFGGRIGHYALTSPKDTGQAPELVSYIDVAFGPFSNLETLVAPDGALAGTIPTRKRLYRIQIEGFLKVPTTPLIVGFNANIGQEAVGTGGINIVQRAGDDLRFLFGAKFDVDKLMGHITQRAP